MNIDPIKTTLHWLKNHPSIFAFIEIKGGIELHENFSQKKRRLLRQEIAQTELKSNRLSPEENYLILLLESGIQLVLCDQGFAFAPDFSNTGELPLPNPVYCMQDFNNIFHQLQHLVTQEDRRGEAIQIIMTLIAILDGARAVGLEVGVESCEVEKILSQLESGAVYDKSLH